MIKFIKKLFTPKTGKAGFDMLMYKGQPVVLNGDSIMRKMTIVVTPQYIDSAIPGHWPLPTQEKFLNWYNMSYKHNTLAPVKSFKGLDAIV